MEKLFKAIYDGNQAARQTQDLLGRAYGVQLAVVADTQDPLKLGQIRVMMPSKGGKTISDWLQRLMPWYGLSVPDLSVGDTVVVAFIDGNPHQGVYLGVLQNIVNPAYDGDRLLYNIGGSQLSLDNQGTLSFVTDSCQMTITRQGAVEFSGVTSFKINGKQVATLGAKDSDGDSLVTKGWT